jgi:hypothetical protein
MPTPLKSVEVEKRLDYLVGKIFILRDKSITVHFLAISAEHVFETRKPISSTSWDLNAKCRWVRL